MKPSDLYIGVSELFSILLPGFLVLYFGGYFLHSDIVNYELTAIYWVLIFSLSYILGHILFAIGSFWDEVNNIIGFKGNNKLLEKVTRIREIYGDKDCLAVNNYQWAKSILSKKNNVGHMEVLRKEADSKLFRSIIIPLILLTMYVWNNVNWIYGLLVAGFVLMVFWRYREQRNKACAITYTHIITLSMNGEI